MKTLYRQGLKNRYGSMMQAIAGVHFNFSLPDDFWQRWLPDVEGQQADKDNAQPYDRNLLRIEERNDDNGANIIKDSQRGQKQLQAARHT